MKEPAPPYSGAPDSATATDAMSFEQALERLEGVVGRLEGGELALEEALAAFEEGVRLSRRCASELDAAERTIEMLVEGGAATRPFEELGGEEG